jgi:hypothetical protein
MVAVPAARAGPDTATIPAAISATAAVHGRTVRRIMTCTPSR